MTFDHILLALDRTDKAEQVLSAGISVAARYNACLTLIHCVDDANIMAAASSAATMGVGVPFIGTSTATFATPLEADPRQDIAFQDHLDREVSAAKNWLRRYVQKAYDAGCEEALPIVRMGDPGTSICELADELETDLIIVGRKDRSGLEALLLGSVSSDVVHHAPCAVLVAQT
jgi:nucleotide-binding universal stress UspA family protein